MTFYGRRKSEDHRPFKFPILRIVIITQSNAYYISYISYFKHIYTGYKFNKDIVLQFGPVKIKVPNKLFTNKLIDKNIHIWRQ